MSAHALAYLDCLYGAEPAGGLIEVRYELGGGRRGMGQIWHPCEERRTLAPILERLGRESDTYVGVAPRRRRHGGRAAIERLHAVWADLDTPESIGALECFSPAPSIVINSGSGRHGHAYWPLWPPVPPDEGKRANRRLAHALGADMAATDAARILRPPGTFNHKTDPPVAVEVAHLAADVNTLAEIVGELPDPPGPRRERPAPPSNFEPADPLFAIPPPVYIEALTGLEVGRDGKTRCPFHDDRTPSLHAYPTVEQGWTCFAGCGGGSIIDLGAALYRIEPRGRGYREIRDRLEGDLLPALRRIAA